MPIVFPFPRLCLLILLLVFAAGSLARAGAQEFRLIDLRNDWGIEPVHLRVTAGGYMIEFRYRVIDKDKALILTARKIELMPRLKAMKSNARLAVPFFRTVGFIKSNRKFLKEGKNYTVFFANQGEHLLRGDEARIQVPGQQSPIMTLQ